jgi:ABC-type glycerol-3-phosphate transport system permease component
LGGCEGTGREWGGWGGRALMMTKRVTTTAHYWAATISFFFIVIFSTYFVFSVSVREKKEKTKKNKKKETLIPLNSLKEGPSLVQFGELFINENSLVYCSFWKSSSCSYNPPSVCLSARSLWTSVIILFIIYLHKYWEKCFPKLKMRREYGKKLLHILSGHFSPQGDY